MMFSAAMQHAEGMMRTKAIDSTNLEDSMMRESTLEAAANSIYT